MKGTTPETVAEALQERFGLYTSVWRAADGLAADVHVRSAPKNTPNNAAVVTVVMVKYHDKWFIQNIFPSQAVTHALINFQHVG